MKQSGDFWDNIPERIPVTIKMNEPNEFIPIYKGQFVLKQSEKDIIVEGEIYFSWFPHPGTVFKGIIKSNDIDLYSLFHNKGEMKLIVNDFIVSKCYIRNVKQSDLLEIRGVCINDTVFNDKTICLSAAKFCIPNFIDIDSQMVKTIEGESVSFAHGRMIYENNDYIITVDKYDNYKDLKDLLKYQGGYIILYNGIIKKKINNFSFGELKEILLCFSNFLSFINGRRTSLLFIQGIFEEEIKWEDFTGYRADTYKSVFSWISRNSINGLNDLWQQFYILWNKDKDFLNSIIHWYVEANSNSGLVDGSIIMAQTGLELLYNWIVIEQKKLLKGKDAENISASNKIRLLISFINLSSDFPTSLKLLSKVPESNDAPDAFVRIRNAIVHAQEDKRQMLLKLDENTRYESLKLGLWYIELSILKILGYAGKYTNRCSKNHTEEYVPWVEIY